jgi:hypothetical protein
MSDERREGNCNIVKDLLPLYVDGTLSPDSRLLVEEHLQICKECSREQERMKKEVISAVETENVTAPINRLKKHYFKKGLKAAAIVVVALLVCAALVETWLLRPALQGFESYDQNSITISEEDGRLVLTPDADAAARTLYYIYQLHEDDTITMYVSYGTTIDQYKTALFERRSAEKNDWQIEPDGLLIIKEELSASLSGEGGAHIGSIAGASNAVRNIATITFSEQVKEIYYAPAMTQEVMCAFRDGMADEMHEYMESDIWEEASIGESEILLPTTFFDFSAVEENRLKLYTIES